MADVRPLRAVHYDLDQVGSLDSVLAPPYDVIDARMRAELAGRSGHNVVELDLPEAEGDKYEHAGELLGRWLDEGALVTDSGDALWVLEQTYTGPDGQSRSRTGFLARIGVTEYGPGGVRPHERTQPGPKEDRLRLTRATRHNLSPIFVLSTADAMEHLRPALDGAPWGDATDADGTVNRIWRIDDPDIHESVRSALADSELLIADGHHRYETARVYAEEIGGDGPHRFTLASVVSLDDPGLEVFGYHRLLTGLAGDPDRQEALGEAIMKYFDVQQVPLDEIDPAGEEGIGVFGYIDAHFRNPYRLWLKDPEMVDELLPGRSEAYRRLDAAILEALILREALGLSEADVEAKKGIAYTARSSQAIDSLGNGTDAAFLMRPTPVEQVRAVAAAGETMPPKSTYFFPKLPTGIVFNPLAYGAALAE